MNNKKIISAVLLISLTLSACGQTETVSDLTETSAVTETSSAAESETAITTEEQTTTASEETTTAPQTTAAEETGSEETTLPSVETEILMNVRSDLSSEYFYDFTDYNASRYSTGDFSYGDPNAPSPDSFPDQTLIEAAKKKITDIETIGDDYAQWSFDSVEASDCQYAFYYDFDSDGENEALLFLSPAVLMEIPVLIPVYADGENAFLFSEENHYESFSLEKCTVNENSDHDYIYDMHPEYFRLICYPHLDWGYASYEFDPYKSSAYGDEIKIFKYTEIRH